MSAGIHIKSAQSGFQTAGRGSSAPEPEGNRTTALSAVPTESTRPLSLDAMFLAHTGHWLVWVLYTIPVFAVLIAVVIASVRARRFAEAENTAAAPLDGESEKRA